MEKEIYSITVVDIGKIVAWRQVKRENKQPNETTWIDVNEPIEVITKNGETAPVEWYRQGNKEWNGQYVIEIEHVMVSSTPVSEKDSVEEGTYLAPSVVPEGIGGVKLL